MALFSSPPRFRILPLTIASLSLLLVAKLYDIYEQGNAFSSLMLGRPAIAVDEAPAQDDKTDAPKEDENKKPSADAQSQAEAPTQAPEDAHHFSDIELDILQSLSERREELNQLEEAIRLKESLLESTELRLDDKIEQIKILETTVRKLLEQYDKVEETQIKSLVKIYENMKPKEAARIFDELDMPILLRVVDSMAERRAAPILAKMSPIKAKRLTQELADDRKLRSQHEAELNNLSGQ